MTGLAAATEGAVRAVEDCEAHAKTTPASRTNLFIDRFPHGHGKSSRRGGNPFLHSSADWASRRAPMFESAFQEGAKRPGTREMTALLAGLMALNAFAIDAMIPALPDIGLAAIRVLSLIRQWGEKLVA